MDQMDLAPPDPGDLVYGEEHLWPDNTVMLCRFPIERPAGEPGYRMSTEWRPVRVPPIVGRDSSFLMAVRAILDWEKVEVRVMSEYRPGSACYCLVRVGPNPFD